MRVGILTGGGDCPGLNAVIRAIVRKGELHYGDEVIGFIDAWEGVLLRHWTDLHVRTLRGMLPRGGTLLGTKRGSPYDHPDGPEQVAAAFAEVGLDALIVIGGNGSLTVASKLHEDLRLPIVGVPKTIDNDIVGTDVTFGFHTAVQIATDAGVDLEPCATAEPTLRTWLSGLHGERRRAAAFDTRSDHSVTISGSAARGIAKRLRRHGYVIAADSNSFFVDDTTGWPRTVVIVWITELAGIEVDVGPPQSEHLAPT